MLIELVDVVVMYVGRNGRKRNSDDRSGHTFRREDDDGDGSWW